MAIKVIREKEPGPGTLGKPELYALAIGQVIGAGVITLAALLLIEKDDKKRRQSAR